MRANKHDEAAEVVQWISEIAQGAAMMTRTLVEVRVDNDQPEVLPNRPLAEVVDRNLHLVAPLSFATKTGHLHASCSRAAAAIRSR